MTEMSLGRFLDFLPTSYLMERFIEKWEVLDFFGFKGALQAVAFGQV